MSDIKGALTTLETGDPVLDHVIQQFAGNPEQLQRYRDLEAALHGKTSQLFIGIYYERMCTVHSFDGRSNQYRTFPQLLCGTLEGEKLQFLQSPKGPVCALPTRVYREIRSDRRTPSDLHDAPLCEEIYPNGNWFTTGDAPKQPGHARFVFGDAEVMEWAASDPDDLYLMDSVSHYARTRQLPYDNQTQFDRALRDMLDAWCGRLVLRTPEENA